VGLVSPEADPSRAVRRIEQGRIQETLAGFRTLREQPGPRLVIALFSAQTLVRGLLNVLVVAASLKLLDMGEGGVGFLTAAYGAGILVGAVGALSLLGRRRLAGPFTLGLVLWGLPIALVAAWPHPAWALLCLAVVGIGNAILDISGYTLLQRTVDDRVLGRVFGAFEIIVAVIAPSARAPGSPAAPDSG
jgi:MFS family permease